MIWPFRFHVHRWVTTEAYRYGYTSILMIQSCACGKKLARIQGPSGSHGVDLDWATIEAANYPKGDKLFPKDVA